MGIRSDVGGIERQYLLDMLEGEGARVLEIGCGDGRLTWHFADLARSVVAFDVTPDTLDEALRQRPMQLADKVSFLEASGIHLPFKSGSFDQALFTLSF